MTFQDTYVQEFWTGQLLHTPRGGVFPFEEDRKGTMKTAVTVSTGVDWYPGVFTHLVRDECTKKGGREGTEKERRKEGLLRCVNTRV